MKLPHEEVCDVEFSTQDMFRLVSDIERYPEFLPWCTAAKIVSRETNPDDPQEEIVVADLSVGYQFLTETFRSKVRLKHSSREILTEYVSGPFKFLENRWFFEDISTEGQPKTRVHFFINFAFKNALFQKMLGSFFEKAFLKMFEAFKQRAFDLHTSSHDNTHT